jgi:hypothetical protein
MSGYTLTSRDDDPTQTVRTIGRIAQMLIELRDEYANRPREDTLQQIERRLSELIELRTELQHKMAKQAERS